jgi:hypothetical protein
MLLSKLPLAPALLFICLLLLGSCDSPSKKIVGKWKATGDHNEMLWEFADNGTVTLGGQPARYSFGDGQRIKIQTPSATYVRQYEIEGDRMIWTEANGTRTELTRVK